MVEQQDQKTNEVQNGLSMLSTESTNMFFGESSDSSVGEAPSSVPIIDELNVHLGWYLLRKQKIIDNAKLTAVRELGKGAYGQVFAGKYRVSCMSSKDVAIKTMSPKGQTINEDIRSKFLREAHIMLSMKHPNIIHAYGVCKGPIMIIMELADVSLLNRLKEHRNEPPLKGENENYVYEICSGMAYLEDKPLVHRDLAARNCLLTATRHVKIADFGLSACGTVYRETTKTKIPFRYISPETLASHLYTNKSDVWSFGVVIFEIFSHARVPYGHIKEGHKVRKGVREGTLRLEPPEGTPKYLQDVMAKTFKLDKERPTFSAIKRELKSHRTLRQKLNDWWWPLFQY